MKPADKFRVFCLLVVVSILFTTTEAFSVSAHVSLFYFNSTSNRSEHCECGLYGLHSPLLSAWGLVGIPKAANLQACDPNTQFTVTRRPWIALMERGNCTFAEKITVAARRGATAAVIYNVPGTGNSSIPMMHFGEYHSVKHSKLVISLKFGPDSTAGLKGSCGICGWLSL